MALLLANTVYPLKEEDSIAALRKDETAIHTFSFYQKIFFIVLLSVFVVGLIVNFSTTIIVSLGFITFLYFLDFIFNLYLTIRSLKKSYSVNISQNDIVTKSNVELPEYTILCPLFKEHEVLGQFVNAIQNLNYPAEKIQAMLLFEREDQLTINYAVGMNLPSNFEIVIVPPSHPQTKPKALNFGLTKARGELVVVYDAEDVPESSQLKKVAIAFEKLGPQTKCIQAKLNFYNPHQNWLTRIFTAEYSLWFDLVLTGLQSIFAPIPLGGTSNHFRTQDIKDLGGWDPYNVTEDADLGMRIAKQGFKTAIVNSTTYEEANSKYSNWFMQRTRWIKGYMQTYLVHTRSPFKFIRGSGLRDFMLFQLIVGGKLVSLLVNPVMWVVTIIYFSFRSSIGVHIEEFFPTSIFYMGLFSFIFGNFLYLFSFMLGSAKRHEYTIIKYTVLVPWYWLSMSAASYVAFYKLLTRPHEWFKTQHGLHLNN